MENKETLAQGVLLIPSHVVVATLDIARDIILSVSQPLGNRLGSTYHHGKSQLSTLRSPVDGRTKSLSHKPHLDF